jgi:hypothetical protein
MPSYKIAPKLIEQLKQGGACDERGIVFMATSYAANKNGDSVEGWVDRVHALSGKTFNMVKIDKGFFGYSLSDYELGYVRGFETDTVAEITTHDNQIKVCKVVTSDGYRYSFDITKGTIPQFDKFISMLSPEK